MSGTAHVVPNLLVSSPKCYMMGQKNKRCDGQKLLLPPSVERASSKRYHFLPQQLCRSGQACAGGKIVVKKPWEGNSVWILYCFFTPSTSPTKNEDDIGQLIHDTSFSQRRVQLSVFHTGTCLMSRLRCQCPNPNMMDFNFQEQVHSLLHREGTSYQILGGRADR